MKWVQHLGISEEMVRQLLSQKPEDISFLSWCLSSQKIDKTKYLDWAKNYYNLPILKSSYFQKSSPDLDWISSIYSHFEKDKTIAPICKQGEKVYAICLEPLETHSWGFEVQWILCDPEDIKTYKNFLNQKLEAHKSNPTSSAVDSASTSGLGSDPASVSGSFQKREKKKFPPELAMFILDEDSLKSSPSEKIIYNAFHELHKKFEQVIFLGYNQKNQLQILRCDDRWDIQTLSDISGHINLEHPSIFRILHRSSRGFHGPVYDSSENQKFFKSLGVRTLPEHVTALSIYSDVEMQKTMGFILATGKKGNFNSPTLSWFKKICQRTSEELISFQMLHKKKQTTPKKQENKAS